MATPVLTCHESLFTTDTQVTFFEFFYNSKTNASEYLENLEDMFPRYCIHSDSFIRFNPSTTPYRVTRCERGRPWPTSEDSEEP